MNKNLEFQFIVFFDCGESYNSVKSSSIRVEAAQSIMKSNYYTIGLYLKSLPDADCAVSELKTANIPELYQRGRKLINTKLGTAKISYELVKKQISYHTLHL